MVPCASSELARAGQSTFALLLNHDQVLNPRNDESRLGRPGGSREIPEKRLQYWVESLSALGERARR